MTDRRHRAAFSPPTTEDPTRPTPRLRGPRGRPAAIAATAALTALSMLASSCISPSESYLPRENVSATSPEGQPAASYSVSVRGRPRASVRVWSEGSEEREIDGVDRTILTVVVELENNGEEPLELTVDRLRLGRVEGEGAQIEGMAIDERRSTTVPAFEVRSLDVDYRLPLAIDGDDVRTFRVEWSVSGDGETIHETTPFRPDPVRSPRMRHHYHYGAAFDPYFTPFGYNPHYYYAPTGVPWYWGYPYW